MIRNEDWSTMRRLLFMHGAMGAPLKEYEAEGNPAVFQTNVAKPLTGFTIPFLPVQSGTGDPSPQNQRPISGRSGLTAWRTGKNIADMQYGNVPSVSTGQDTNVQGQRTGYIKVNHSAEYVVTAGRGNDNYVLFYGADYSYIGTTSFVKDTPKIVSDDAKFATAEYIRLRSDTAQNDPLVMLEVGDTATPYAEYTGAEYKVTFPALGKNLITDTGYRGQFFNVSAGTNLKGTSVRASAEEEGNTITVTTTYEWFGCIFATDLLPPGKYNVHFETEQSNCRCSSYVTDNELITKERYSMTSANRVIELTENARIAFVISNSSTGEVTVTNLQVEKGESFTNWEPFTNTVYGGTAYPLEGRALVEWAIADLGTLTYEYVSNLGGGAFWGYVGEGNNPKPKKLWKGYCSAYKYVGSYNELNNVSSGISYVYSTDILVKDTNVTIDDPAAMKAALDGVMLAYEIEEPYEIPLDPITIQTLLGDNVIWTDTNGSNTIKYKKKG